MLNARVSRLEMADSNMNSDDAYSDASTVGTRSPTSEELWQNQVLAALQYSAPPEPIRLACMNPVPNKPFYFDEEFHGNISREKVDELLGGSGHVNGRFLVRESIARPGDYSLSLTFGGKVEHYHLFYIDGMYSTSKLPDEKKYASIVELVVDILELLRQVHGEQPPVIENKERKSGPKARVHGFKTHHYKQPKWCDICGKFMWGFKAQGLKCDTCGLNIHQKCIKAEISECKPPTQAKPKAKKKTSNAGVQSQRNSTISVETFRTQCNYQETCVRFLQYLNLPVSLFDSGALSPCYCDHCCQEVETPLYKSGDPPREYSIPMGWCRFQIAASDKPPVNTCSWNMAFMSLSAQEIMDTLENKFQSEPDSSAPEMPKPLTKLTPSIICADLDSPKLKYADPESDEKRAGQVALQVYVQPYSYRLMGRAGAVEEVDPYFKKESIYWVTNQMCYVVPFALLVKTIDATYLQL